MVNEVVVIGGGGHGREVIGLIEAVAEAGTAARWHVRGVVDDAPSATNLARLERLGVSYLGSTVGLTDMATDTAVALGIGDPRVRRVVAARPEVRRLDAPSFVHPAATVSKDLTAGGGLLVFAGARVTTNVTVGQHVQLGVNCSVAHDCELGDFVSLYPLAVLSGDCEVGDGVLVGTTAAVLQGLRIGNDATVGAGACVVRDVAPGAVVKGVPAR